MVDSRATSGSSDAEQSNIVSIGGAAIDVFVRAPHSVAHCCEGDADMIQFPLGSKIKVEEVEQTCGGGATNTAVGFSRLGMIARFCGIMGDDEWGGIILATLKQEGVLTDAAIIVEREVSSFSIILVDSTSGRRTILYSPNVNAHMCDPVFPRDILRCSEWIFLNHLSDASTVILDDCLELIAKPGGRKFAWNPGGTQIRQGVAKPMICDLLAHTDILFLNKEEALQFTQTHSIPDAFKVCFEQGVRMMCISDGKEGAFISDGSAMWYGNVPDDTQAVDTTGAGDAFATGVTWGVWRQMPLSDCLHAGMINASSVIGYMGTKKGLLTDTELTSRLKKSTFHIDEQLL